MRALCPALYSPAVNSALKPHVLHGHASTQVLIVKRMELLHNEFKTLLEEDRQEDLGRMYRLLHRTSMHIELGTLSCALA